MSVAGAAFLYLAIAASGGAVSFLTGQRTSGKTAPEVESCYEHALLLESAARELNALCEEAAKAADLPPEARAELEGAREKLEDAIGGLRRGADLVV